MQNRIVKDWMIHESVRDAAAKRLYESLAEHREKNKFRKILNRKEIYRVNAIGFKMKEIFTIICFIELSYKSVVLDDGLLSLS